MEVMDKCSCVKTVILNSVEVGVLHHHLTVDVKDAKKQRHVMIVMETSQSINQNKTTKRRSKTMSDTDQQSWGGTHEWGAPPPPPAAPRTDGAELFYLPVGDSATIRIGTPAYTWDNRKPGDEYPWEKFACGCILKTDSANPGMEPKAIVLTEEGDILRSINEIAATQGSPLTYDLKITKRRKTQENGYSSAEVIASKVKDAGLSEHEISLLAEGQCSTVGQVEATMLRVTKSKPKTAAPKPAATDLDDLDDPFA